MPPPPFFGARSKLDRAKHLIGTLEAELAAFQARKPLYRRTWLSPENPAYMRQEVHLRELPPISLAMVVGDTVHNLRSVLDLVATEAARLVHGDADKVHFPFAASRATLAKRLKDARFDRCGPLAVALLLEYEPFPEGNALLCSLHELDIIDKHRMIVPAITSYMTPAVGAGIPEPYNAQVGSQGICEFLISAYGEEGSLVSDEIAIPIDLEFRSFGPFDGARIIPKLKEVHAYVAALVDRFASAVEATVASRGS